MSDLAVQTPLMIHTWSKYSAVHEAGVAISAGTPSVVTWVANLAVFVPITLPFPYLVKRVWWQNGSTLGSNADAGVYNADGVRLLSAGSTVQSGTSTLQAVTLATPRLLLPGRYYLAAGWTGTTSRGFGTTNITAVDGRNFGILQQATAIALPATATFATLSNALVPMCGISRV